MSSNVEVIINESAGTSHDQQASQAVVRAFANCGVGANVAIAHDGGELIELARRAVSNGARAVVAGGGDGTVSAVASQLIGTGKPLGVLPLGTLNHFAKDLGVPLKLEDAARSICEGREVRVDVGEVNGQIFINNSGLGLYPRIVLRREKLQERSGSGKWSAFFRAALAVLRRYTFLHVRLTADGRRLRARRRSSWSGITSIRWRAFRWARVRLSTQDA